MTQAAKISVLIVDDHQVVREGLRRIIELDKEISVVGEAQNGQEAIDKAVALTPDVILMDLKMPVMDGITATREISFLVSPQPAQPPPFTYLLPMATSAPSLRARYKAGISSGGCCKSASITPTASASA